MEHRESITALQGRLMRTARRLGIGFSLLACVVLLGCQSSGTAGPERAISRSHVKTSAGAKFSSPAAWRHLRALNKIGPRVSGSAKSEHARKYLRSALDRLEIHSRQQRVSVVVTSGKRSGKRSGKKVRLTHLTAVIPGRSSDVLLLAAHYDTSPGSSETPMRRSDQRASGPALLLELARALNAGPTPEYTVWLSWIDGDALDTASDSGSSEVRLGTQSLVDEWSRGQEFSQIRAAIFFGDVGDRDKPIGRDIDSPRVYRETFWQVAQDLGYGSSFPADGPYGLSSTGRQTFAQANLRSSIALANLRTSHIEPPVEPSQGQEQAVKRPLRPSAGFEAVGNVTLEALRRIAAKLRKIDSFARSPLTAGREEAGRRSHRD
ncbi:MAG: M28 family peptidase [Deltaproteobacteria bacterium]|nr:M28 family peptidase [Deltaproteobacteria bacterium]